MKRLVALVIVSGLVFAGAAEARKKRKRMKGPEVCAQFSAEVVKAALGEGFTEEASRYAPLCSWSRPLPDAEAKQEAYSKEMMAWSTARVKAQLSGKEAPPMPKAPATQMSVSVSWRGDAASAKDARGQLASAKRTITEGITVSASGSRSKGFKTKTKIGDEAVDDAEANAEANAAVKDATKGAPAVGADREISVTRTYQADVEDVAGVGDGAFWDPKHRALTVVKGKRMFTVTVGTSDADAKALAIQLAKGWM